MKPLLAKLEPLLSVATGLALGLLFSMVAGDSPWTVLKVLAASAFGSGYGIGMTLFYAMPLTLTGLAVAAAFRTGLFNVGAEGQLTWGALAAASVGALWPSLPPYLALPLGTFAAMAAGALWGWVPGALRAYRGSHEVITTIMLNFIAAAGTSYVTLYWLKNPEVQNPETLPVGAGYLLAKWEVFQGAPLGIGLFFVLAALLAMGFYWRKSVLGYEEHAVGQSEAAARFAGVPVARAQARSMAIAGALAGLVGVIEVYGNSGKFRPAFSPDYGFMGIAVAMLGRGSPVGIFFSALLFGALHKGSVDLDFETEFVTRDISKVIQACVIFSVSADALWARLRKRRRT